VRITDCENVYGTYRSTFRKCEVAVRTVCFGQHPNFRTVITEGTEFSDNLAFLAVPVIRTQKRVEWLLTTRLIKGTYLRHAPVARSQ